MCFENAISNELAAGNSFGHDVSYWMYGDILHGSHGPQVDVLVAMYKPPHYGRLRPLGIIIVLERVKAAHAQRTTAGATPVRHVVSEPGL